MAATGHKQTSDRIEFCRVPNCKQNNYRDVCQVAWKSEAHHILCVAQVNKVISGKKGEVKKVIDESKWCINCKKNMIALPLWGTTVMFYCDDFSSIKTKTVKALMKGIKQDDLLESETGKPPFKNLPQHNYGHSGKTKASSYNKEIEGLLQKWVAKVQVDIKAHSITGDDVHDDLNDMADDMRDELKDRGKRKGCTKGAAGTHDAWMNPADNWYEPFSMAQTPKKLPFPQMVKKIVKIAQALWR